MLRAQLKLESLLGRRSGKFVLKESNQDHAEFIPDFGYWWSWVTEVFLRSCCLPTQTYQNHCKVHVVAEIIANTSWKKTLKFFHLNTIQSTILSLLLFRFLVYSDSTFLVQSDALQYVKQRCCDYCSLVSWDLWVGDHVCLPSGNECIRDGRFSRVSLSSTKPFFPQMAS